MAVYDECLSIGSLSLTQTTGIVRLLYKKGDRSDLRNWRPISLLTADYKILAKALVSRLSKFLPSIVHEDQSCVVPGRSIRDSNRVLQDVVDYCDAHDLPAGLVSLDQEKAFDRVDWSFLDRVLTALNIGPRFRSYVTTLYAGVSSRVLVNGWLSRRIYPKRCPSGLSSVTCTLRFGGRNARRSTSYFPYTRSRVACFSRRVESRAVCRRYDRRGLE